MVLRIVEGEKKALHILIDIKNTVKIVWNLISSREGQQSNYSFLPAAFLSHLLRTVPGQEIHREFRSHISLLEGGGDILKKVIPKLLRTKKK